ncbi:MAG: S10 family peptidase [Acidobacteriota bacterium]
MLFKILKKQRLFIFFTAFCFMMSMQSNSLSSHSVSEPENYREYRVSNTASDKENSDIVVTRHQINLNEETLSYTARAGKIPIRHNETGEIHAHMFFVAYELDRSSDQSSRPLTFLWNGGPGSNSSLLHLIGFGPKRLRNGEELVDNQSNWLEFTDLVFVDPVGTGYSRPTKAEYGKEFYQTKGDAESVAEFIRVYRNRYEAWDTPLFIGGESFGVTRAAGVANVLQRREIPVHGVILISSTLPLGQLSREIRTALMVPTYTAAAYVNSQLEPDLMKDFKKALQKAENWAKDEYAPALTKPEKLSDSQKEDIISDLARFTGLDSKFIDLNTLSFSMGDFAVQLLQDQNKVIGRYDSRVTGPFDSKQKQYDPTKDPSLKNIIDHVSILRYLRNNLQYKCDLLYQGPFGGGYPPSEKPRGDWMSVKWNWKTNEISRSAKGDKEESEKKVRPLRKAMDKNPDLKVFMASGFFDLVCGFAVNRYIAEHLDPEIRDRVITKAYTGGHAIYTDKTARTELSSDVKKFIKNVLN